MERCCQWRPATSPHSPLFKLNATFTALPRHYKAISISTRIDVITELCLLNALLITCRSCVPESQG